MLGPGPWLGMDGVSAVLCAVGLLGFALAVWGFVGRRSRGRRRCRGCGYDMRGTDSLSCSECGRRAASEKELFKPRRRPWAMVVGLSVAVNVVGVLYLPLVVYRQRQLGETFVTAIVPTTVWIALLPYVEMEEWEVLAARLNDSVAPTYTLTSAMSSTSSGGTTNPFAHPVYGSGHTGIFGGNPYFGFTLGSYDWNAVHVSLELDLYGSPTLAMYAEAYLAYRLRRIAKDGGQTLLHRYTAINWLQELHPKYELTPGMVVAFLDDTEPHIRGLAMLIISKYGLGDQQIVDRLCQWLDPNEQPDPAEQRMDAIHTLANLGVSAAERIADRVTTDKDDCVLMGEVFQFLDDAQWRKVRRHLPEEMRSRMPEDSFGLFYQVDDDYRQKDLEPAMVVWIGDSIRRDQAIDELLNWDKLPATIVDALANAIEDDPTVIENPKIIVMQEEGLDRTIPSMVRWEVNGRQRETSGVEFYVTMRGLKAVPWLEEVLEEDDAAYRLRAVELMGELVPQFGVEVDPALVARREAVLQRVSEADPDEGVREAAGVALEKVRALSE